MGKAKTMNNSMNIYKEIFIWVLTRAAESDIISYYGIMGACAALACTAYFALGFSQPGKEVDFMTRSDARKAVLDLLFEREFRQDESNEAIFSVSCENREIDADSYMKEVYFGVCEHQPSIDALIEANAKGWKVARLSRVSRSILRLCVCEMKYMDSIPAIVSINEGLELAKLYEDEKARPFINGVLHAVKESLEKEQEQEQENEVKEAPEGVDLPEQAE